MDNIIYDDDIRFKNNEDMNYDLRESMNNITGYREPFFVRSSSYSDFDVNKPRYFTIIIIVCFIVIIYALFKMHVKQIQIEAMLKNMMITHR